jgi:glycosyltransferase involved in cell wall biosynthesis
MASADIFLFPSETDTAGNVVLEAQACGLPVLVTNTGGPKENLRPGASGFICRPNDVLDFFTRISELVGDSERRRAMSQAARTYATGRSWAGSLEPLFSRYRAAVEPKFAPYANKDARSEAAVTRDAVRPVFRS